MSYSSCTQVGFPHPSRVRVPCDMALKAVAERYIVLGWTSCICNSPPLPPTYVLLASIVLLCFIEYTLKADTPDIWPKLNFCSHRRWAFLPYFLTSIQTPHLWYYWCTRQYGHVRAVFDSILNNFFLEFVQAQDLGFCGFGTKDPHFQKLGLKSPEFKIFEIFFWISLSLVTLNLLLASWYCSNQIVREYCRTTY